MATDGASRRIVEQWDLSLKEIDALLVEGKPKQAYRRASKVLEQAANRAISGPLVSKLLGLALVLKAIAAHQVGEPEEALWLWHSALIVFPPANDLSLTAYGGSGAFLHSHPAREDGVDQEGLAMTDAEAREMGVDEPLKRFAPLPTFPGAQFGRNRGVVVVQTIIDEGGRVTLPRLVGNTGPVTFVCATLDKLSEWRFKPARKDGQAVAVYFNLTVNFVW